MSSDTTVILMIIGMVALIVIVRFVVNAAVNKGADAIHNAGVRAEEEANIQKNVPDEQLPAGRDGRERLMNRYIKAGIAIDGFDKRTEPAPAAAQIEPAPVAAQAAPAPAASMRSAQPTQDLQFCPQCGSKLRAGAHFCTKCGTKVS